MDCPFAEVQMSESLGFSDNLILCLESSVKYEIFCVLISQQIKVQWHSLKLTIKISFQLSL